MLPFDFEEPIDALNMASITCSVIKGDAPIDISWKFNNSNLFSNDGVIITRSGQRISVLSIETVRSRHAGLYTCVGKNTAGYIEHSAELKVNGITFFSYIYVLLLFFDHYFCTFFISPSHIIFPKFFLKSFHLILVSPLMP